MSESKRVWLDFVTYLVEGKHLKRIPYKPVNNKENPVCGACGVMKNSLHKLNCDFEKSPCGKHDYAVLCTCDVYPGESV